MSKSAAFTLIELLVVMAIITVLTGLLIPAVRGAMGMARSGGCKAHLHAAGVGFRLYLNDHGDVMPVAAAMPSLGLTDEPRIADVLGPFLAGPDSLRCPADSERDFFSSEGSSYEYRTMLGGHVVGSGFLSKKWGETGTPVLNDYEPFHGRPGTPGAMNYLFADGHVGDLM
jgi:prepilin-type N-terminal cleavage/methylation domain-containing protein/prepilin-type processing-associated H-X9-DG protein